jgi:hypothetical protein
MTLVGASVSGLRLIGRRQKGAYITPRLKTVVRAIFFRREMWRVRRAGRGRTKMRTSVAMFKMAFE